jgi:hypothetical protein
MDEIAAILLKAFMTPTPEMIAAKAKIEAEHDRFHAEFMARLQAEYEARGAGEWFRATQRRAERTTKR